MLSKRTLIRATHDGRIQTPPKQKNPPASSAHEHPTVNLEIMVSVNWSFLQRLCSPKRLEVEGQPRKPEAPKSAAAGRICLPRARGAYNPPTVQRVTLQLFLEYTTRASPADLEKTFDRRPLQE